MIEVEPKMSAGNRVRLQIDPVKREDAKSSSPCCLTAFMFVFSYLLILCFFPLALLFCVKIIREYERAVIFRLGRVGRKGLVGPGMFFIIPCIDQVRYNQSMSPIAKIEIAIAIAISKMMADRDLDRSFTIADRLGDLFT